jgi:hypothetical protein
MTMMMEQPTLAFEPQAAPGAVPDVKDVYDRQELLCNQYILENAQDYDPTADLAAAHKAVTLLGWISERLPRQSRRTIESVQYQMFSTPPAYGYAVAWVAKLRAGDVVLEPSAGVGGIAVFAANAGCDLVLNELSSRRANLLRELFELFADDACVRLYRENADHLHSVLPLDVSPTVVTMNPPFSATAGRLAAKQTQTGALHVEQSLKRLETGGRLVAILGRGMAPDRPAFARWWETIRSRYTVRANVGVDGKVYARYGTHFDTRLVVIDKVGADPGTGCVTGDVENIPALLDLLAPVRELREYNYRDEEDCCVVAAADVSEQNPDPVGGQHAAARGDGTGLAVVAPVAVPAPVHGDDRRDGGIGPDQPEPATELTDAVFEAYRPQRVLPWADASAPHPTPLVQSAAMASVLPPEPTYVPHESLRPLVEAGMLSDAQLEAVVYAGQAHGQHLPPVQVEGKGTVHYRRAFMIGDATGLGKGREISAVIRDSLARGQTKAVWVSKSQKLLMDARRDWQDLGGNPDDVFPLSRYKLGEPIDRPTGILFATYATLRVGLDNAKIKKPKPQPTIDDAIAGIWSATRHHYYGGDAALRDLDRQLRAVLTAPDDRSWALAKHQIIWCDARRSWKRKSLYERCVELMPDQNLNGHVPPLAIIRTALGLPPLEPPAAKATKPKQSRLRQVVDWLGTDFSGVFALDECHAAKNALGKE